MNDTVKVELDRYELGILINSLREFRNIKINQDFTTDCIDDLYVKFVKIYEKQGPFVKLLKEDYAR